MYKKKYHLKGFFLIEIMIVIAVLVIVLVGYLQLSIVCFGLAETTKNITIAISEIQSQLDQIRNYNYSNIVSDYSQGGSPGDIFSLSQLDGVGIISLNNSNPELLEVEITACWQEKGRRIIGEDINLNGVLDADEDKNANGKIDSPASLITLIAQR